MKPQAKHSLVEEPEVTYNINLVELSELSAIEGRILTIVEGLGFPSKQEEAVKSLIRQAVWNNETTFYWSYDNKKLTVWPPNSLGKGTISEQFPTAIQL